MKKLTGTFTLLLTLISVLLSGCLPIELSVSDDGTILIPRQEGFCRFDPGKGAVEIVYAPESMKPAMALFAPDGKTFLAVGETAAGSGGFSMGNAFSAQIVAPGKKPREILRKSNLAYARWSPDGTHVAVTRIADKKKPPIDQNMPELIVIDVAGGNAKTVAGNVSSLVRWFGDSKSILTFQIAAKGENNLYSGTIARMDPAGVTAEPLAVVRGGQDVFFDLSPKGDAAVFTAVAAAGKGGALPKQDDKGSKESKLFCLDIKTGAVRAVVDEPVYALFSPDGSKLLVGTKKNNNLTLSVWDAAFEKSAVIAKDAAQSTGSGPGSVKIYPTWYDTNTVVYLANHASYGTKGLNLHLVSVGVDGTNRMDLQGAVEAGLKK